MGWGGTKQKLVQDVGFEGNGVVYGKETRTIVHNDI